MAKQDFFISLKASLVVVFLGTLAVMTIFEIVKQTLNPGITIWESHIITILFTSCLAIIIAYFTFQSLHEAHRKASEELEKRITAENHLRKSEAQYRSFVESADESIYTVDREGKYLLMNTYYLERQGISSEEFKGKTYADLHSREETGRFFTLVEKVMNTCTSLQDEYERQGRSFLRQLNPVIDPASHEVIAVTVISSDITERKQAEKAILETNRKLNIMNNVTRHDILNQLTALSGYLELGKMQEDTVKSREFFEKCKRAADTIRSQITFTREYQDIGIHTPEWQNLHDTIERSKKSLALGNIQMQNDCSGYELYADPLLVKVFYNLADNALRYAVPFTHIHFTCEKRSTSLVIICEDDGSGISLEEKARIFLRGYGKNTGYGLFLIREILSITGLTISETGEPGRGARFEIAVPEGKFRVVSG
ncbi:MAG: PAS domain S-box protein [Methanoregula sp.]